MSIQVAELVRQTQAYYDGAADQIYREIWGENIHLGRFAEDGESLQSAMQRSNESMVEPLRLGPDDTVLDVGCGYGALARFLARRFGCRVLATNISERELAWGEELTREAGLDDQVAFEWADFHELPYASGCFECYWSQEAFLHAGDKPAVLGEAARVLKPGGQLVFSDLLVRRGTPEAVCERIYERLKVSDMWDTPDYLAGLEAAGLEVTRHDDWSENVAPTYAWVRGALERRRGEFEDRIGKEAVDRTSAALQFWVDAAADGRIGWEYFLATKPN